VTGNLTLLRQMVLNLLDNAVTYNHPGGQVKILVGTDRHTAVLEVRNTGPRVDPSGSDRLFEPFYRSDQSRMNSDRSGHGLGLTIVRNIVRAHHGSVTAVANPDGGLTVRVEIPRAVDG
jgi:signal transduction histidine kinase